MLKKLFLFAIILLSGPYVAAQMVDTYNFHHEAERQRAITLAKSLRCPQCQNQNLVESNSPIASDLRLEVYQMVNAGKSNQQIIQTMTQRFGDFVRYDPPFKATTFLLWLLPLGILAIALGYFVLHLKNAAKMAAPKGENIMAQSYQDSEQISANKNQETTKISLIHNKKSSLFGLTLWLLIIAFTVIFYIFSGRLPQAIRSYQQVQQKQQQVQHTTWQQHQQQKIQQVQQQLRSDKNNGEKWGQLAQLYMAQEQYNNALVALSYAEKLTENKAPILGLAASALYYKNQQQFSPKVKQLMAAALAADPLESASLSLQAMQAFQQQNYAQAIILWREILDSQKPNIDRQAIIERINTAKFLQKNTHHHSP